MTQAIPNKDVEVDESLLMTAVLLRGAFGMSDSDNVMKYSTCMEHVRAQVTVLEGECSFVFWW